LQYLVKITFERHRVKGKLIGSQAASCVPAVAQSAPKKKREKRVIKERIVLSLHAPFGHARPGIARFSIGAKLIRPKAESPLTH